MDAGTILGIVVGLFVLWAALIVLLWLVRPRDIAARELLRVVPDLVRLLRSIITDRRAPLDVRIVLVGLVALDHQPDRPDPRVHPGTRTTRRRSRGGARDALRDDAWVWTH